MASFKKYPKVVQYLAGLPKELGSYPECVQKASVLRQFLKLAPPGWRSDLPHPLEALVRDPPPFTAWIPEVHAIAVYLAIVDAQGWTDRESVDRALKMNREFLQSPLYRILMTVVSPRRLVLGGTGRWKAIHPGIELAARMDGETSARFDLAFPRRLVPTLVAQCYAMAFHAALERASAREVRASMLMWTDESAAYRCDWT